MIIKPEQYTDYAINQFNLLENNETGLSKAFAYVISKRPDVFFKFLRFIGLERRKSEKTFKKTSIEVEKFRNEGRTDIEIFCPDEFHIIIECKVGNNKIQRQREQYIDSFYDVPIKILCFLSQTNDYKMQFHHNIDIKNIGWIDIDNLIEDRSYENDNLISEFQSFLRRGYKLRNQKEILIQDLSDKTELKKYLEFNVYRRDTIFGSPLYFSPYFTRQAGQVHEGIWNISKILGIITAKPKEIISFKDDLQIFADSNKQLVEKWLSGVKLDSEDKIYTYFFLDDSVKLAKPLLKDGGIEKGRGKNWIAAKIPKNRCVTFQEFVKRMTM
mgnify:CR=1 FL=1